MYSLSSRWSIAFLISGTFGVNFVCHDQLLSVSEMDRDEDELTEICDVTSCIKA